MMNKPLESIDESDLQLLVSNNVAEGKIYDYKRDPVGNSQNDRKEFLFDISSFANTSGGHLIIGVDEDKGLPTTITGIDIDDFDIEKNRLDQIILAGIQPRMIPAHQIHGISLKGSSNIVIVIRVHQSLTRPHMVTFQNTNKFYARHSHGKYLLDVGEIRNLISVSEGSIERIKDFRTERIGKIISGETPLSSELPKVVMHLAPLSMSDSTKIVDLRAAENNLSLMPMRTDSFSRRFNFDGLLHYTIDSESGQYTYCQLFRNGAIEAVDTFSFRDQGQGKVIKPLILEDELIKALQSYMSFLSQTELEPPFFVMISLLGVRDYKMLYNQEIPEIAAPSQHSIDRDNLVTQEVIIDSFDVDYSKAMKTIFDSIWNSCGLKGSMNYDENGNKTRWRGV